MHGFKEITGGASGVTTPLKYAQFQWHLML